MSAEVRLDGLGGLQRRLGAIRRGFPRDVDEVMQEQGRYFLSGVQSFVRNGGVPYRPLRPLTRAYRQVHGHGAVPLNRSGALLRSLSVVKLADGSYFVGVRKSAASGNGGLTMAEVASIHEFGTRPWRQLLTWRQLVYLHGLAARTGIDPDWRGPGHVVSTGVWVTIQVPKRSFLHPAWRALRQPIAQNVATGVQKRLSAYCK